MVGCKSGRAKENSLLGNVAQLHQPALPILWGVVAEWWIADYGVKAARPISEIEQVSRFGSVGVRVNVKSNLANPAHPATNVQGPSDRHFPKPRLDIRQMNPLDVQDIIPATR